MITHSSAILAWKIPWTEEPGGLQSIMSQELDTVTKPAPPICFLELKVSIKVTTLQRFNWKVF